MNTRYTALPIISAALKLLAWLVIILGVLGALKMLIWGPSALASFERFAAELRPGFLRGHLRPAIWGLIETTIRGLILLAASEGIHVGLDIEENTRRAADAASGTTATTTPLA